MRHRRSRTSFTLGVATALVATSPFIAIALFGSPPQIRAADDELRAVPTRLSSVPLSGVPDIVVPLPQLSGLNLPNLHLPDLKEFVAPPSVAFLGAHPISNSLHVTGPTVKELARATPFSMVALTAHDLTGVQVRLRAQNPDGSWSPWAATDEIDTYPRDGSPTPDLVGTDPVYVGRTHAVQLLISHTEPDPGGPNPAVSNPSGQNAALDDDLSAVLIEPSSSPDDDRLADIAAPVSAGGPKVISRAQWGADESLRCGNPVYDDAVEGAVIHHTGGRNDYTRKQSAGIVRALYAYQAQTLHWCDIGYNVLIDKYGQIFEGRAGGLNKPVRGSHTGGFNANTIGVGLIGNYRHTPPSTAMINAVGRFLGWRLAHANLDPQGHTTLFSAGSPFTSYASGASVDLPVIFAHRDVGLTDCPGAAAYAALARIRAIAATAAASIATATATPQATTVTGATSN